VIIKTFTVGPLNTNTYLIFFGRGSEAVIIDPAFQRREASLIISLINSLDLKVKYIINTHGHFDHILGNNILKERFPVEILIHKNDALMLNNSSLNLSSSIGLNVVSPQADRLLDGGETINLGGESLKVIYTPGHTSGSISLLIDRYLFTGDTLFAGSVGRTDLPGGSLEHLLRSVRKLVSLPDHVKIYPGHGVTSTIGIEKKSNPYVKMAMSREHF